MSEDIVARVAAAIERWLKEKAARDHDYFWAGTYVEEQAYRVGYDGYFDPAELAWAVMTAIGEKRREAVNGAARFPDVVSVCMTAEMGRRVRELARVRNETASAVVRVLVAAGLKAYGRSRENLK